MAVAETLVESSEAVAGSGALAALVQALGKPIACLDLETTGMHCAHNRITEVGLVRIDATGCLECWSSLVDPECWIPPEITLLTGIDADTIAAAPTFHALCDELLERLDGHIVVAHNARFDLGFLKQSFGREGVAFKPPVLCSVKLSRALFPGERRHGLDSVMRRLGLDCDARHRALGDARVVADFLARLAGARLEELVATCRAQWQAPSLPAHISAAMVEAIPDRPGVYLIHGENDLPLYIGKSVHMRRRVRDHFRNDQREQREMRLAQQARRIDWIETAGELSALLLESRLIKERSPVLNRRLRRTRELCTIAWSFGTDAPPRIVHGGAVVPGESYGAFRTAREAQKRLKDIAAEHGLCDIRLGFQKGGGPCFAHQIERCRGVCVGKEPPTRHDLRLAEALQSMKIARWPYPGPIALHEQSGDRAALHVVDQWIYLGEARDADEALALLQTPRPTFDIDMYRILLRFMDNPKNRRAVRPLWPTEWTPQAG